MIDTAAYCALFAPRVTPTELQSLLEFQNRDQSFFSSGFEITLNDGSGMLSSYSANASFQSKFIILAQADGTGSSYAFWLDDQNKDLSDCPIAIFGSEGGVQIVGSNLRDLLQLLSLDAEPMADWSSVSYFKDKDDRPSARHEEYLAWLSQSGLSPISDPDDILTRAQSAYQPGLDELISSSAS